jgi:hypothetical protein
MVAVDGAGGITARSAAQMVVSNITFPFSLVDARSEWGGGQGEGEQQEMLLSVYSKERCADEPLLPEPPRLLLPCKRTPTISL